jgi:peptidoglycan/LPS O-acetylase OafA/YrhL
MPVVDAFKAVATQLVILHHLAFYGPLSDAAQPLAPAIIGWLSQHARIAVQVFFVVAGFLAAHRLAPTGLPSVVNPLAIIGRRYWRLAAPYVLALMVAIAGAAIARVWLRHESIPDLPTLPQILAHVLLLQSILDYDALTAGAWYVAIDFQLFALTVVVLWLAHVVGRRAEMGKLTTVVAFSALTLVSLLYFNLDAQWDVWAMYFVGAYALGALAYWAGARDCSAIWLVVMLAAGVAVMTLNTRPHTVVALSTALVLGAARQTNLLFRLPSFRPIGFLGQISYSVFLVHFPVCLVVNALFNRIAPDDPGIGAVGMLVAWATSIAAGALFHAYVEKPLGSMSHFPMPFPARPAPDRRGLPAFNRG